MRGHLGVDPTDSESLAHEALRRRLLAGDAVAGGSELVGGQQLNDGEHIFRHGLTQHHSLALDG